MMCDVRQSTISCNDEDNVLIIFMTVYCKILSIDTEYNTIIDVNLYVKDIITDSVWCKLFVYSIDR